MLGLQNEREWRLFCDKVLRRPVLADDPRFASASARSEHRAVLRELIVEAFAALDAAEVLKRLDDATIASAQLNDMHAFWKHPQLAARRRWVEVGSPVGPLPALLPPGNWDGGGPQLGAVPALGEHTAALLAELGLDADAIAALRATGAV